MGFFSDLTPMSWSTRGEMKKSFFSDLIAGVSVGIIALPLALAFAIASGVTPEKGLYTVLVAGFLISLLGGSRYQIGGPTGAYVLLVLATVTKHGIEGLQIATLISGVLLCLMGVCKVGKVMKFVPQPVISGFTAGIAVVILASQLRDFFGLQVGLPADFLDKCTVFCQEVHGMSPWSALFGLSTTGFLFFLKKKFPRLPGAIVAMVLATLIAYIFSLPLETIEGRYGVLPSPIPPLTLPPLSFERLLELFPDGVALALLGGIESLLSAAIADKMTRHHHRSNAELFGQGMANIFSSFFGGIPATGAIARTSSNIRLGGKTPVAGMIHALTIFLVVLFFSPLAGKIPLAVLAGILVFVAWNMGEFPHLIKIARAHKTDGFILATTLCVTVLVDLVMAVEVGIVLSALLLVRKLGKVSKLQLTEEEDHHILAIHGPLFFTVGEDLKKFSLPKECQSVRIDCASVTLYDSSGALAIKDCLERWKAEGIDVQVQNIGREHHPLFKELGVQIPPHQFKESSLF